MLCRMNNTYENVASSCAARRRVVVVVGALRGGMITEVDELIVENLDGNTVRVVCRIARRADVRRVAADLEVSHVTCFVIVHVVLVLVTKLVKIPAKLLTVHIMVKNALIFLKAIRSGDGRVDQQCSEGQPKRHFIAWIVQGREVRSMPKPEQSMSSSIHTFLPPPFSVRSLQLGKGVKQTRRSDSNSRQSCRL